MDKTNKLINILNNLKIESAKIIEENIDLQYEYLNYLYNNINNNEIFLKLTITNSLVCYQLSSTGENYWKEFSQHNWNNEENINNNNFIDKFIIFLKNCKGNKRLQNIKINRINKIKLFLENISINDLEYYYNNMEQFRENIAKNLKTKKNTKTVVFSIKMFGYTSRMVFNKFNPYPYTIEIPVDSRITKYTKRFTEENPILFWNNISKIVNVPPLHIDALIWCALGDNIILNKRLDNLNNNFIKENIIKLRNI